MDETGNAVSQLRQSQEQAIAEFKKHGETLGETYLPIAKSEDIFMKLLHTIMLAII